MISKLRTALRRALSSILREEICAALQEDQQAGENNLRTLMEEGTLRTWSQRRPFDIEALSYLQASLDSTRFFRSELPMAENCVTQLGLLSHAAGQVRIEGLWLEFGVFEGTSLRHIAGTTQRDVFGFDSFEGLPEDWSHFQKKGRFSTEGKAPADLPDNAHLVPGWFSDTLPEFLAKKTEPAAFVHIDCDLYSSTRTVLTALRERIVPGTIIVFDEFFNYPGWRDHEFKAWQEFVDATGCTFDYLGFASSHFSVAIRITGQASRRGSRAEN